MSMSSYQLQSQSNKQGKAAKHTASSGPATEEMSAVD